jgi:hypothetical protein
MYVYGDTAKRQLICNKGAVGRPCTLPAGTTFSVDIKTDRGPPEGFQGYQIVLQYRGVTFVDQPGLSENVWPECPDVGSETNTPPSGSTPGRYTLVCKAGPPPEPYKGVLANIHFSCVLGAVGQIDIIGGAGASVSFYDRPSISGNRIFLAADPKTPVAGGTAKNVADAVRTQCGNTAGGTIAAACAPAFDPTGDGQYRIDDVLAVVGSPRTWVGGLQGWIAGILGRYGSACS